ncbi:serine/threonine protein kinase, CMGC, dual-specificity [Friedmanniomyces endolithicus]|nr:serine/threonine protein kinase, CMGC, dual-specificity [Friedmanniomyces endolithicus]KAK0868484.1 serine/threonine protein kinase, CMGC, dual-specificity [Friedmanniomyces endolithicus]
METATRFQPRVRAQSFLDRERDNMPDDSEGDSSESVARRKYQRTAPDSDSNTFRKPSLPASASRPAGLDRRPSLSNRRKSTLRENIRVPSGPREFPSPGKRLGSTSSAFTALPLAPLDESTNAPVQRPFLSQSNSAAFNSNSRTSAFGNPGDSSFHFSGNHNQHSSVDETDSPATPAEQASSGLGFLPTMTFDDFQNSITDPNWTSPLLSEFPTHSGGRALPKDGSESGMARSSGFITRPGLLRKEDTASGEGGGSGVGRNPSFRRRISAMPVSRNPPVYPQTTLTATQQPQTSVSQPNLSLRTRRQSNMPQTATAPIQTLVEPGSRQPRKSVGPGVLTNTMEGRKGTGLHLQPAAPLEPNVKPTMSRTSSLNAKARRTTLGPAAAAGAEAPIRGSTLTATTQSQANKAKSLQPPSRQPQSQSQTQDPDTPRGSNRDYYASRSNREINEAHTPSSSGNKRQSAVSGRASGLGARTISPTDARRLKRMSMLNSNAPPMPTSGLNANKVHPSPPLQQQDDIQHNPWAAKPELPRLSQPSPSLIPRKMSSDMPSNANSTRASPIENASRTLYSAGFPSTSSFGGGGGAIVAMPLSAKSSYQSLLSNQSGSTSRLPTPKPRNVHSSNASRYEDREAGFVPPVPAIPKAYESPVEVHEQQPFFSGSMKLSHSMLPDPEMDGLDFSFTGRSMPLQPPATRGTLTPRGSMDLPAPPAMQHETPRKASNHQHMRSASIATADPITGNALGGKANSRPQPLEHGGRKNPKLQPVRLPPLNLMPINTPTTNKIAGLPHPSMEVDGREGYASAQTPEPVSRRRANNKTPSTPMTASKATFFSRRQDEGMAAGKLRTSTSHYALRDLSSPHMERQGGGGGGGVGRSFYDDSDAETVGSMGVPILGAGGNANGYGYGGPKSRSAITPFASGSLPKHSGEFASLRSRPSGEYYGGDEYDLGNYEGMMGQGAQQARNAQAQRPKTSGAVSGGKMEGLGTPVSAVMVPGSSPEIMNSMGVTVAKKEKESVGNGLRRKLSLGWRRSSSKGANHAENLKADSQQQHVSGADGGGEKEKVGAKLQKRQSEMPPPTLPASTSTSQQWLGEGAASARPSLELPRRKNGMLSHNGEVEQQHATPNGGPSKTRALHSEQPQPVPPATTRASSWAASTFGSSAANSKTAGPIGKPSVVPARHKLTAPTISALVKDKDDLAADEEMRRLSLKRKDVDTAAKETEALRLRAVARAPVSPDKVLQDRGTVLNIFERGEIVEFERSGVYFAGAKGAKKIIGCLSPSPTTTHSSSSDNKDLASAVAKAGNYGYDDERGDYNIVMGDHLAYRYEVVDMLGKGSFGQVVRCVDHKEGGVVAVKIIRNKKRFHQQALVEVGILGRLGEWDPDGAHATLSITTSFYFRSHLCIVTPCLSINLYEFIRAHSFNGFPLTLIRRFARQLLACLVLLQTKRIIHCDLKPENILLCEARKADVRVIDFGSSCREEEKVYTYIQSRFYRSPEVILGSSYGLGIDMWSLGCILAELWTGYPLFPGENEQEQLACIMEIFGPPDRHLVERCTRKKLFFDSMGKPRVTVSSRGRRRRPSSKTLQQALKTEDEAFVDFIARCLRWDPERRMKASEGVGHPFVTGLGFHQRAGIPEEARRGGARVRSSAAIAPATNGGSPTKRNAFAQAGSTIATTPAKEQRRALPETPQTALRNGGIANGNGGINTSQQGSPSKASMPLNHRRHSTVAAAGAAVAGSKRASNGAVLGHAAGVVANGLPGQQQQQSQQRLGSMGMLAGGGGGAASLAQMAARESMGGAFGAPGQGRWRS